MKRLIIGLCEIQVYDAFCRDDSVISSNKELWKELVAEANDLDDSNDNNVDNDDIDSNDDNDYSLYYNFKVIKYYILYNRKRKHIEKF